MRYVLTALALLASCALSACVVAIRNPGPLLEAHEGGLISAGLYSDGESGLLIGEAGEALQPFCFTEGDIAVIGTMSTLSLESGDVLAVFSDVQQYMTDDARWRRMPGGFPFLMRPGEGTLSAYAMFAGMEDQDDLPPFLSRCDDPSAMAAERLGVYEVCMAEGTPVATILAAVDTVERVDPAVLTLQPETMTCEALMPVPLPEER